MSDIILIDDEDVLLKYFGKPIPTTIPHIPTDFVWLTGDGLSVGYAPPQQARLVRVTPADPKQQNR